MSLFDCSHGFRMAFGCLECAREWEAKQPPTQADVLANLTERFGPDRDLPTQFSKFREEFLELLDAWAGIDGDPNAGPEPPEGWEQNFRDELADVVLVCMAIAGTVGFDLNEAIASKWSRRKRGPVQ